MKQSSSDSADANVKSMRLSRRRLRPIRSGDLTSTELPLIRVVVLPLARFFQRKRMPLVCDRVFGAIGY
jgi:hypothetical protein